MHTVLLSTIKLVASILPDVVQAEVSVPLVRNETDGRRKNGRNGLYLKVYMRLIASNKFQI